jgi:hypothetical protein
MACCLLLIHPSCDANQQEAEWVQDSLRLQSSLSPSWDRVLASTVSRRSVFLDSTGFSRDVHGMLQSFDVRVRHSAGANLVQGGSASCSFFVRRKILVSTRAPQDSSLQRDQTLSSNTQAASLVAGPLPESSPPVLADGFFMHVAPFIKEQEGDVEIPGPYRVAPLEQRRTSGGNSNNSGSPSICVAASSSAR